MGLNQRLQINEAAEPSGHYAFKADTSNVQILTKRTQLANVRLSRVRNCSSASNYVRGTQHQFAAGLVLLLLLWLASLIAVYSTNTNNLSTENRIHINGLQLRTGFVLSHRPELLEAQRVVLCRRQRRARRAATLEHDLW